MSQLLKSTEQCAFVAGATGLTGRHVVAQLRKADIRTVAHVRPDSPRMVAWSERFGADGATICDAPWILDDMTDALCEIRPSLVFALLGTTKKRARAGDGDYAAVDFGLTALLIDAVVQSETNAIFVYLSSAGVSPNSTSAYMSARARVEAKLATSGLGTIVARPSFIVGDRDEPRPGESVGAGLIDSCLSVVSAMGGRRFASRYSSMRGEELAAGLCGLAVDPNGVGRIADVPEIRRATQSWIQSADQRAARRKPSS